MIKYEYLEFYRSTRNAGRSVKISDHSLNTFFRQNNGNQRLAQIKSIDFENYFQSLKGGHVITICGHGFYILNKVLLSLGKKSGWQISL